MCWLNKKFKSAAVEHGLLLHDFTTICAEYIYHRRRINTEEKAKVVTAAGGTEFY